MKTTVEPLAKIDRLANLFNDTCLHAIKQPVLAQDTQPVLAVTPVIESLFSRYQQLSKDQPNLRRREQGSILDVPEAALIDEQCGVESIRLLPDFSEIIHFLPSLGYIMTLTRNESAVHERKGVYSNISIKGPMGIVITDDRKIDLRIILSRWVMAFAVQETLTNSMRYSLQFFDKSGVAIQKVYLQDQSDFSAYQKLVERFSHSVHSMPLQFVEKDKRPVYAESGLVDKQKLQRKWLKMTNVHQFFGILKQHNISREQAFELVGPPLAQRFDSKNFAILLADIAKIDLSIMCFVGNHGNIQIHTGAIKKVKKVGPWLNILDPEFNLHLLEDNITSAWVIKKPTVDGDVTSVELYDEEGETIVQIFGQRAEGQPENQQWRRLAEALVKKQDAA